MCSKQIQLRLVRESDCQILWEWTNHPTIRSVSFSQNVISWEEHLKWFTNKLNSNLCCHLVGVDNNQAIGQVRFDISKDNNEAEISISIAPEKQGCGYGTVLIKNSSTYLFSKTSVDIIHAFIKEKNFRSIAAFKKAGFWKIGNLEKQGCSSLHFQVTRDSIIRGV